MKQTNNLWLVPTPIAAENPTEFTPIFNKEILETVTFWVVENAKIFRRFLSSLGIPSPYNHLTLVEIANKLNEANVEADLQIIWNAFKDGKDVGLVSDAGCPGIADPGNIVVKKAHELGVSVMPLTGASSIFLALMASGLNGQQFSFHGYLPIKPAQLKKRLQFLEQDSQSSNATQIFIETPYRNQSTFKALITTLKPATKLCIAYNIYGETQQITTKTIGLWQRNEFAFEKYPCVFLFMA
ncbi:MAG: SAM-dependent methyltransferase [Bacteroidetes bacterium]|nr:SAM-dependent methyltransferase [Bacteroidota bacterium]